MAKAASRAQPALHCYAVVGVVGEWTEEGSAAYSKGKKIEIGGLFGAAKNVRPFKESERQSSLLRACQRAGCRLSALSTAPYPLAR
jgi:hypothetical protein